MSARLAHGASRVSATRHVTWADAEVRHARLAGDGGRAPAVLWEPLMRGFPKGSPPTLPAATLPVPASLITSSRRSRRCPPSRRSAGSADWPADSSRRRAGGRYAVLVPARTPGCPAPLRAMRTGGQQEQQQASRATWASPSATRPSPAYPGNPACPAPAPSSSPSQTVSQRLTRRTSGMALSRSPHH